MNCTKDFLNFISTNIDAGKQVMILKANPSKDFPRYSNEEIQEALEFCKNNGYIKFMKTIGYHLITGITSSGINYMNQ